jgi:D-alanyl-D-alanine carboxypeptidase
MMNDRAKELGMTKTHYEDPHGLSEQNRISCEDMLILAREAMKIEEFRNIVCKTNGTMPATNKHHKPYRYNNSNRVMAPRNVPEYMSEFTDDIIGIKTGYIKVAGYNLACCMDYDEQDMLVYSVVMNGKAINDRLGSHLETINLMRWARTFHKETVSAGQQIALAATQSSKEDNVQLVTAGEAVMLTQTTLQQEVVLDQIGRSVKAGDVLGKLKLTDDFGNIREIDLVAAADAATDMTTEYLTMTGLSLGSLAVLAVISTLLRKRKTH